MKVHVHWVNLMKNQIIQQFQTFEFKKKRATTQMAHFLNMWHKHYVQWVQNV
jgi:hypothetical protein